MKKESFFILAIIVLGMWMIIRTLFWWSANNNNIEPIIQDNPTSITQELDNTSTDNIDHNITSSQEINNEINNSQKEYTEIKVMMPKYFYNTWRKSFAQDLYDTQKIYMNFVFIDNLNLYRDKLLSNDFNEADLILFPYDWIEWIAIRPFSFQQSIKSQFDDLIVPIVNDSQTSFLPFAVDPMIMYVLSGYSFQSNFSELSEFIYTWEAKKPMSFPIFFGIIDEDYLNQWLTREYQDIVRYALMHYFTTYRDSNSLWKWIDTNVFESYNLTNMKNIINILNNTPYCDSFTAICTQIYNFVTVRFWFMSDADIVKQYFPKKKSDFEKILQKDMPFSTIETPIRVRWRSIPNSIKDTSTINAVYKFLWEYMTNHHPYSLWNSTLSVFIDKSWNNLINNNFIWTRSYIMRTWWNYMKLLKTNKSFRQLINYQISAKDYLKKV